MVYCIFLVYLFGGVGGTSKNILVHHLLIDAVSLCLCLHASLVSSAFTPVYKARDLHRLHVGRRVHRVFPERADGSAHRLPLLHGVADDQLRGSLARGAGTSRRRKKTKKEEGGQGGKEKEEEEEEKKK